MVREMRQGLKAGAARLWAAAFIAAIGAMIATVAGSPAFAYSGAQAEAQTDPSPDPYSFPNIKLCCQKKSGGHRRGGGRRGHGNGGGYGNGDDWNDDDWRDNYGRRGGRYAVVSCNGPHPYAYGSVAEALDRVGDGGRIRIRPGAACDISGLVFDRGVTIESGDYEYGGRAELRGRECAHIATGYSSSVVRFDNIDIDGCISVEQGRLDFKEVNLASRGDGDAVTVNGGTFSATDSTIRARGTAINARRGLMVSLTGGGFASGAKAEHTILLDVEGASVSNTLIKGGKVGVRVGLRGRYPVNFNRVTVQRGDAQEIFQIGPGQAGVIVGGGPGDDLPSLPNLPGIAFTIEGGMIAGYGDGLVVAPGTRAIAKGVSIAYPKRGIVVASGATVELSQNKISKARSVGIDLASGAAGSATFNDIQCEDGECVCYGGDCTSRSDRDFGRGLFRMSGTRCDD